MVKVNSNGTFDISEEANEVLAWIDDVERKNKLSDLTMDVRRQKSLWQEVANKNNWENKNNIFVQVWFNQDSSVNDSVSHLGLKENIYILCDDEENEIKSTKSLEEVAGWFQND